METIHSVTLFRQWHFSIGGKMLHRSQGTHLSFHTSSHVHSKIQLFCELSVILIPNLNSYCGSSIMYMFADHTVFWDLLSQHSECAAANGNVGGVSTEGFAFSIDYWNPKTRNEPEETSSALLCICLWPRSKSKDPGLISQFCTCTPANFFQYLHQEVCRHMRVGFRSEMNIYFYQLGKSLDKCSVIITLTKPELYL